MATRTADRYRVRRITSEQVLRQQKVICAHKSLTISVLVKETESLLELSNLLLGELISPVQKRQQANLNEQTLVDSARCRSTSGDLRRPDRRRRNSWQRPNSHAIVLLFDQMLCAIWFDRDLHDLSCLS